MFDHVTIRASDGEASLRFYSAVLDPLGFARHEGDGYSAWGDYELFVFEDPVPTLGLHIAFVAPSRDIVDEFWRVATRAGYESDGAPGPRPEYDSDYCGAFVLDPDGNSVEAVYHGTPAAGANVVDHMWIRVADLGASKRFYETLASPLGLRISGQRPERFHVAGGDRSFALVSDDRTTKNLHIAFPAADNATVDEFHRVMLAGGYRDNGAPGERGYHPGYYAAFVLDPDGNNIEVVNHNRG